MFGSIINIIWGTSVLLTILIVIFAITYALRFYKITRWAIVKFWGHIRGMTIMTLLPSIFVSFKTIFTEYSLASLFELIIAFFIIIFIWFKFDEIIRDSINRK